MKTIFSQFTLVAFLFLAWGNVYAQNIYVRAGAIGANNGSSWADAYTSLDAALVAATPGKNIWVASGTYKPNTAIVPNNSFQLQTGVEMYGGFAGTETTLAARNLAANPTILSGDINGDDILDSLTLNKADNAWHVLIVSNGNTALRGVVDGFIISHGATKTATADPDQTKRGGGVLAIAKLTIRNCTFTQNFAVSGGGLAALDAASAGLIMENCLFERNLANSQTAGAYLRTSNNASIKNCLFRNNVTTRGCLYPQTCKNVVIDSCLFENNKTLPSSFGAALFTWQSSFVLKNSIIRNNQASTASGMYNDGRDGGNAFTIENCLFEANTSDGYGAGIYNWQANATVRNCIFRSNTGSNSAGIYNDGRDNISSFLIEGCLFEDNNSTDYGGSAIFNNRGLGEIKSCTFDGNTSPSSAAAIYNGTSKITISNCLFQNGNSNFGAAMSNFGLGSDITINDCTFKANKANTSGGALINGFIAKVTVNNSLFEGNLARFGGAVFCQNDSTAITINDCAFNENNADNNGGAINVTSGIVATIARSTFFANSSNYGAAIEMSEDSLDLSVLNIERCLFQENLAFNQGGALNLNNANTTIVNSLFAGNANFSEGAGGAISCNGFGGKANNLKVLNCTFADNAAVIGAGIGQFEDETGTALLEVQNSVFSNIGNNYEVEDGEPAVVSLGGNISADNTLQDFNAANDRHNTDPSFVNSGVYDFRPAAGSPMIDNGIAAGAPAFDISGAPRLGLPDSGCFEFGSTGTTTISQTLPLEVGPNPASDWVYVQVDNAHEGTVGLTLTNHAGVVVARWQVEKGSGILREQVVLAGLPQGIYLLEVEAGRAIYAGRFVKF
jgi:predicted outer membrane repeat protein